MIIVPAKMCPAKSITFAVTALVANVVRSFQFRFIHCTQNMFITVTVSYWCDTDAKRQ